jgi:DNA-binding transcriptional ArsR family regulator
MEEFKPLDTFQISNLDTLKVVADPLRSQMLEVLTNEALTVREVAEKLGLSPSKLYYHINLLEKHGLIQVVETRLVANMIEKLYRAAARNLEVDPALFNYSTDEGKENINSVLVTLIDATRDDLQRSLQARYFALEQGAEAHPRRVLINRVMSRVPDERAEEFQDRLAALMQEFAAADNERAAPGALQPYALTIALYPSFYFR